MTTAPARQNCWWHLFCTYSDISYDKIKSSFTYKALAIKHSYATILGCIDTPIKSHSLQLYSITETEYRFCDLNISNRADFLAS